MKPSKNILNHPYFKLLAGMLVYTEDNDLCEHRMIDEYTAYDLSEGTIWYAGNTELEPNGLVAVDIEDPATLGCLVSLGFTPTMIRKIHEGTHYSQRPSWVPVFSEDI